MKKLIQRAAFPLLLIITCVVLHFWQHAGASLPYLPMNGLLPLATLSPALFALTFFTTFALLKQTKTPHPVRGSFISMLVMLAVVLALGVVFVSYLSYRFAAVMPPLPRLSDVPTDKATLITTILCVGHLTGLLTVFFVKRETPAKHAVPAALGWLALNVCLFLITT